MDKRSVQNLLEEWAPSEKAKAKAADLVILPPNIQGTNCGNCKFFQDGRCLNANVGMNVQPNFCCIYWDAEGVKRVADSL